jgi:hypothetical protein
MPQGRALRRINQGGEHGSRRLSDGNKVDRRRRTHRPPDAGV